MSKNSVTTNAAENAVTETNNHGESNQIGEMSPQEQSQIATTVAPSEP